MNSWAALEHRALSPHWESEDSQQPVFKGPAIVQTEEPILKTCGPGKEGGGKSGSAATWESPASPKSVFRDWAGYRQPGQAAPWQHWDNHEDINMPRDAQWKFNRIPMEFSPVSLLLIQAP